ncbi:hypothetical protein GGR51DRAFT_386400 [Nemania sp. FL0031]|nr:hypothetical protein GGR51DRAFT_386400 [Nemania sp. FL0031]
MDQNHRSVALMGNGHEISVFPPISEHRSIRDQYLPSTLNHSDGSDQYLDLAQEIYTKALQFHKQTFPENHKKSKTWLSSQNTLDDVVAVLRQAKVLYETRRSSRSKRLAIGSAMWTKICSRVMQYSQIIDTLISSHPEYAAIVWGGLRFIFTVTLNYENLASRVAEAFLEIVSALDDAEFIAFKLYPVNHIKRTTIELYAGVVEFCIRATKWYQDTTKSVRRKILLSIINPWPLEFEDIKLKVDGSLKRLYSQSAIAHRAETRDMNLTLQDLNIRLTVIYNEVMNGAVHNIVQSRGNTARFPCYAGVSSSLLSTADRATSYLRVSFDPTKVFNLSVTMRNRRRSRKDFSYREVVIPSAIYESVANPRSSLVRIKASTIRSEGVQDCVLDIAERLKQMGSPVIWFLGGSLIRSGAPITVEDVLKSMIQQMIDHQPEILTWAPVNDQTFDSCKTSDEWLLLFVELLSHIKLIFIVIDGHERLSGISGLIERLWELLSAEKVTTVVKMIVLTYQRPRPSLALLDSNNSLQGCIDIDFSRHPLRTGRLPICQSRRQLGSRHLTNSISYLMKSIKSRK